jgi:4-azaleucine resistance transporter AzlC
MPSYAPTDDSLPPAWTDSPVRPDLHPLRTAWLVSLPVVFGYLPIGFAYGLLAIQAGLSALNAVLMSVIVYAGSAQLIAVSLLAAGAPPLSIVGTTFIVNLRHLLMSAALAPYLRAWRGRALAIFAYELTDESFAIHATRFAQGHTRPPETLAINLIAQSAWVLGTLMGVLAGSMVTDVSRFGLDYALVAMFIALLVFQIKERRLLVVALLSGSLSILLLLAGASQWNVILATLITATLALGVETWTRPASS